MNTYNVELIKVIVCAIEAESQEDAIDQLINDDSGFDGAWERAEPTAKVIGEVEIPKGLK